LGQDHRKNYEWNISLVLQQQLIEVVHDLWDEEKAKNEGLQGCGDDGQFSEWKTVALYNNVWQLLPCFIQLRDHPLLC
jgi:hypothetical protein